MKYKCPKCGEVTYIDDSTIVALFNELVKEGKIERKDVVTLTWRTAIAESRLRPTPRYRAFKNGVEAAGHLGRCIKITPGGNWTLETSLWSISKTGIIAVDIVDPRKETFSFTEARNYFIFADTGEPFGVKI